MNFSLYLTFGSQDIYMKNILFPWSLSEQRRCTKRAVIASAIKFDWLTGKKVVYIRKTSSRYVIGQPNSEIALIGSRISYHSVVIRCSKKEAEPVTLKMMDCD